MATAAQPGGPQQQPGQDGPVPDIYPENLAYNAKQIYFLRSTSLSLAGATAGVLGLRNLSGFYFFGAALLLTNSLLLLYNARSAPRKYIPFLGPEESRPGTLGLLVSGGQENLFSFVLWWTFWFGIVHVYD
ncbi:hypothetical protein OC846_002215 [Tilletia horrida]|uniref:ER membrane protein complex subunit 6 n=1 Tax=Tilletia horrida TaxID=155126 RepID=A0AAN6GRQ4_9BASI|nr:hypothetical protein OC846_002215 [Tilletia horrida]KAK0568994.1 hypothetical protein OC861_001431 [Tilletia horrida]